MHFRRLSLSPSPSPSPSSSSSVCPASLRFLSVCLCLWCCRLSVLVPVASGHGSMVLPPPRNAIDVDEPAWSGGKHPETGVIEPYTCDCTNGTDLCNNGQACFWFSQGCSIGCAKCDAQGSRLPNYNHCLEVIQPTLNDPKYRTANQHAAPGSREDIFKYNPWRAPGMAPVEDACGMAGGSPVEVFNAGAYNTTKFAKQGDLGSKVLPPRPGGIVWKRGSNATVRFELTAGHGGGYQYRLCPASEPLTEECFQKMPLKFATETHVLRFADPSKDKEVRGTIVKHGGGIGWMVHPIPNPSTKACDYVVPEGEHCDWKCPGCGAPAYAADTACPTSCAAAYPWLPKDLFYGADEKLLPNPAPGADFHAYSVENQVVVPSDIPAGDYVVGWRWDCEMTSQVWSNCADITID